MLVERYDIIDRKVFLILISLSWVKACLHQTRKVWIHQRGNQKP